MTPLEYSSSQIALMGLFLFFAIVFLQSGVDKCLDYKGNLGWLKGHFEKSPLASFVPLLLLVLTITELLAGAMNIAGFFFSFGDSANPWGYWAGLLNIAALLMLFFGQRLAKDYEGAKTIAIYFILAVLLLFLFP